MRHFVIGLLAGITIAICGYKPYQSGQITATLPGNLDALPATVHQ